MKRSVFAVTILSLILGILSGCTTTPVDTPPSSESEPGGEQPYIINAEWTAYEEALAPLAESGLLFTSWASYETADPALVLRYCVLGMGETADTYKADNGHYLIPADEVEQWLYGRLAGQPQCLRESEFYSETDARYDIPAIDAPKTDYSVGYVIHALSSHVVVNEFEDGTGGVAILEIDDDIGGRYKTNLYQPTPAAQIDTFSSAQVNRFLSNLTTNAFSELFAIAGSLHSANEDFRPLEAGFTGAESLNADYLFSFYALHFTRDNNRMNASYSEKDNFFHIPVSDVTDVLDKSFEGYTFFPEDLTWRGAAYLPDTDEILLSPDIYYIPNPYLFAYASAPESEGDNLTLTAHCFADAAAFEADTPLCTYSLTLKIMADGYRFVSLEVTPA